jgi:hypothetical protein
VVVTETHRNADGTTTTVVLEKETEAAREKAVRHEGRMAALVVERP